MSKFRLGMKLSFNRDIVMVTVMSTLLIMLDYYHRFTGVVALDRVIIYLLAPLLIILFVEKRSPKEYGFQLGDWKAGLVITAAAILIIAPVIWYVARGNPEMTRYYQAYASPITPVLTFLDLIGWEFFFRGWLLFSYQREFGDNALWLQAVPFALAHIGKPELETFTTIFGGFLFGLVAWRTKSFLYPFLIHWFVFTFTVFAANGGFA